MRYLWLFWMAFCCWGVYASGPSVRFERFTVDEGLSQNTVTQITQDSYGFLWVATRDGLNRYDGYNFKVYRHNPKDSSSLANSFIYAVFEDSRGNLWVGSRGGLHRYDRQNDTFVRYIHDEDDNTSLPHQVVRRVFEDNSGQLWIGTYGGLARYQPQTDDFSTFSYQADDDSTLRSDRIRDIYQDSLGILWVATDRGGVSYFDGKTKGFKHYLHDDNDENSLSHNRTKVIIEGPRGDIWIGTHNGLNRLNRQTGKFKRYFHDANDSQSVANNTVIALKVDNKDQLWAGTLNGLDRYDESIDGFYHLQHQSGDVQSISDNNVWSIYQDRTGVLWVGTVIGLNKYNVGSDRFVHFRKQNDQPKSLSYNNVMSIFQTKDEALWIGTAGGGLNLFNPQSRDFTHFLHHEDDGRSLSDGRVFSMAESAKGQFWVGTANGLNLMDRQNGTFTHFVHDKDDDNSLSYDMISALWADSNDTLWVGTYGGGLNQYMPKTGVFKRFMAAKDGPLDGLSHNTIRTIFEDSKLRIWVGTLGGGLNLYQPNTQSFKHYKHNADDDNSISHNAINAVMEDNQGRIWIATDGGGFNLFDEPNHRFIRYREEQGLVNDTVYGILQDDQGFLWLSTNHGYARFDPKTELFRQFDVKDGAQSNEFNGGAFYKLTSGELVFGGINGFNRFFGKDIIDDTLPPKMVLTEFYLFNQPIAVNKGNNQESFTINKQINQLEHITLNYKQTLMGFEFSGLHFANAMRNQYQFMLEGFDTDWVPTDAKMRRATYTNIPSGDYRFVVRASNQDGFWHEQGKSIAITITPAPWETWWAYTIYAVLIIGSIVAIIRNERKKVEQERAIVAQLMQVDKLKDEFLANTSHELRTPLNGIIGIAESLVDGAAGQLPELANRNLAMVVSSGRRLADLVNDILDFSKLNNAGLELFPQPLNMHDVVDVVLTLSKSLVGDKPLELVNEVPKDLPAALGDEDRVHQILHNLVGNGIKFTESGKVSVTAVMTDVGLCISVQDTGIGIAEDKFEAIFESFEQLHGSADRSFGGTGLGLAVCKQLVELHAGQLTVNSKVGVGSIFSFTLPSTDDAAVDMSISQAVARLHLIDKVDDGVSLSGEGALLESDHYIQNLTQKHASQEQSEKAANLAPLAHLDGSAFRILLVDDEPVNRQVLRNHLRQQNYQLVEAVGGQQALDILQQCKEEDRHFDLILLDIMMPKVSGYDVCKQLREEYPVNDLPVIFLTAKNQVTDLVHSFACGANDYLSKPVSKHELLTRVETHLKLLDINRNLEGKVAERTVELEQATQAKSDFLAKMSHEIRTPINAVIGLSRLTLKSGLGHQQRDYVEKVVDAGEALLALINDILDFSKIEAGKLSIENTEFCLETLVQRAVTLSAMNAHSKGLELITQIDHRIPNDVIGDSLRLQQIVVNLINNAVKFTETGFVYICVGIEQEQGEQLLLRFSVQDSGIGMDAEQQSNLFQSFSQADDSVTRKYGGTGLGLAISKQLSELMGGEIWLESEAGVGSTFHFTVQVGKPEQQQKPQLNFETAGVRVLVVDDSPICRQVIQAELERFDINVTTCGSCNQAATEVEAAYADKNPYDLVILDWQLSESHGTNTIKRLEQVCVNSAPMPYIVMASTYDKDEVRSGLTQLSLGYNPLHRIIEKPVARSALLQNLNWVFGLEDDSLEPVDEIIEKVPNFSSSTILLVEDNAINRQVALGFLQDTLIDVDIAENGLVAVNKVQQQAYDLVFMDIQMPQMDGISATKEIRNNLGFKDMPIIAMTAHAMEADVERSFAAGMNEHITKPIDPPSLYALLGQYLPECEVERKSTNTSKGQSECSFDSVNDDPECERFLMSQLENVVGIDAQMALGHMNGRTALYLGLVKDFEKQQKSLSQALLGFFDDQQWQALYRSIHSLKSNAAYIGAYELAKMADKLESALGKGEHDKDSLLALCDLLRIILGQLAEVYPKPGEQVDLKFSTVKFKKMLTKMMPLLASSDIEVEEQLPALTNLCSGSEYESQVAYMVELIDDVEYEQAVEVARELLRQL